MLFIGIGAVFITIFLIIHQTKHLKRMDQSKNAQNAAEPAMRVTQIDAGQLGDVNNSVNLYRAEVNLPLTLLSLPGRGGLDVSINAMYSSNVNQQVNTWNMESPTGLLGLGWQLATTKIVLDCRETSSYNAGTFYLIIDGQTQEMKQVGVENGAVVYQTKELNVAKILFYPDEQRWTVVNEAGLTYKFGGDLVDGDNGVLSSVRNLYGFGVSWDNWIGSSTRSGGKMFVKQWNLEAIQNIWGEQILFEYDVTNIKIGNTDKNLSYTRSTRLRSIKDVNQRMVYLYYSEKSSLEIQYPIDVPGEENAFQFAYEKLFLSSIQVQTANYELLSEVKLDYEVVDMGMGTNFYKRYLTRFTQYNDCGQAMPAVSLEYYWDTGEVNPGALKKVYYPQGAVAKYTYSLIDVKDPNGENDVQTAIRIEATDDYNKPQVWYGSDYTIICWQDRSEDKIKIQVLSWQGQWVGVEQNYGNVDVDSDDSEIRTFEVLPNSDFFTLKYKDTSGNYQLVLWHKNPYKPGTWQAKTIKTAPTNANLQVAIGKDFVVCAEIYQKNNETYLTFNTYYWDFVKNEWESAVFNTALPTGIEAENFSVAAKDNYFAILYQKDSNEHFKLLLYYRGQDGVFYAGPDNVNNGFVINDPEHPITYNIKWNHMNGQRFLAAGSTFVGFIYINDDDKEYYKHIATILNWDSDFNIKPDYDYFAFTTHEDNGYQAPFIEDALFAAGDTLCRYNGQNWDKYVVTTDGNKRFFKAYGSDAALIGVEDQAKKEYDYYTYQYDLYDRVWKGESMDSLPMDQAGSPSINGNYQVYGNTVYYKNSQLQWVEIANLKSDFAPSTIQNLAPSFISSYEKSNNTRIYYLANGDCLSEDGQNFPEKNMIAGYNAIILFSGTTLKDVTELTLIRYTDSHNFNADPIVRAVSVLEVDNGGSILRTHYHFDADKVVVDPYSKVAQFTRAEVKTKAHFDNDDEYDYGWSVSEFFSGQHDSLSNIDYDTLDNAQNVKDYYGLLAGLLYRQRDYDQDKNLVHEVVNTYQVINNSDMYGAYIRQMHTIESIDGVEKKTAYDYNSKGQKSNEIFYHCNSWGKEVELHTKTRFAWEHYSEMAALNLLNETADTTRLVKEGSTVTVLEVTANTFRKYTGYNGAEPWAAYETYQWKGTGNAEFKHYDVKNNPLWLSDWLKTSTNASCNKTGQLVESIDVDGIYSNIVYDKLGRFPIAQFLNARTNESFYCGFEDYENRDAWTNVVGCTSDSFTGTKSLCINNGYRVQRTIYPTRINQVFMLGFWIKTPIDFPSPTPAAQFHFQAGTISTDIYISPTYGKWAFQTIKMDLTYCGASPGSPLTIAIHNDLLPDILIDNIFLCPAVCEYEAIVYGTKYLLQATTLGIRGEATRIVYDSFQQPCIATDVNGDIIQMTAKNLWRRNTNPGSRLNYDTAVKIQSDSSLYTFSNYGWRNTWQASNDYLWLIDESTQQLVCTPNGATHDLTFKDWKGYDPFALRVNLAAVSSFGGQFTIVLGKFLIYWYNQNWYFEIPSVSKEMKKSPFLSGDCLLVVTDSMLSFYGDGELLFNYLRSDLQDTDTLKIQTNATLRIDALAFGKNPTVSMAYKDSVDNVIQDQIQIGLNCTVVETFYDRSAQAILKTLPKVYTNEGFGYRANLIQDFDFNTGRITSGDIADEYGGYAFNGKRYELSPLARILETGMPGPDLAINPSTPLSNRHTVRVQYEQNKEATDFFGLPAGRYAYTAIKNQDNIESAQLTDNMDNIIADCKGMVNGQFGVSGATTRKFYDYNGNIVKIIHPKAFEKGNASSDSGWTETFVYNIFGLLTEQTSSDTEGLLKKAYDNAGRLRYKLMPDGSTMYYYKYDLLGRIVEEGSITLLNPDDWTLYKQNAANPTFLSYPQTVLKQCQYGIAYTGNTTETNNGHIGRLMTIKTPSNNKIMAYSYDLKGHIVEISTRLSGYAGSSFGYEYGKHDEILSIWDKDNESAYKVIYEYTGLGQLKLAKLLSNGHETDVTFAYNKNGNLVGQTYKNDNKNALAETFTYNDSGWLAEINSDFFTEKLFYDQGGYGDVKKYYSGKIASLTNTFNKGIYDGNFLQEYGYSYEYDNRGQLKTAQMTGSSVYNNDKLSMGLSTPNEFDLNGNITKMTGKGVSSTFYIKPNKNQIEGSFVYDDKGSVENNSFTYDAAGNLKTTSVLSPKISWGNLSQQPEKIEIGPNSDTLLYDYDFNNQRIQKQYNQEIHEYGLGIQGLPLKRTKKVNCVDQETEYYLYGQKGLLLIAQVKEQGVNNENCIRYILKDHLGSTRALVNAQDLSVHAAYNYMPFGTLIDAYGNVNACKYLYTGQEFDSEVGLYNYKNRTYDPAIARFYNIDPKNQFASPYLYVGNDPILYADFTGEWSGGAVAGLIIGAAGVAAGLILMGITAAANVASVASGGLSAPVSIALGAASGALLTAGVSGVAYSISNRDDFSWGKYTAHVAVGAIVGGVTGAISCGISSLATAAIAPSADLLMTGAITGVVSSGKAANKALATIVGVKAIEAVSLLAVGVVSSMVQQTADLVIDNGLDAQIISIQTISTAALNGVFSAASIAGSNSFGLILGKTTFLANALPIAVSMAGVVVVNSASPVLSLGQS